VYAGSIPTLASNNRLGAANHRINAPGQLLEPPQVRPCLQNHVSGIASIGDEVEELLEFDCFGGVERSGDPHQLSCATCNDTAFLKLMAWLHASPEVPLAVDRIVRRRVDAPCDSSHTRRGRSYYLIATLACTQGGSHPSAMAKYARIAASFCVHVSSVGLACHRPMATSR
jgi:hypothetical protein